MQRARSAVLAIAIAGAGCNQVFGIADTHGPDSDQDGISDSDDNCPLVANPDQADRDGDGFGDACDPCIDGPQTGTDNDHDGVDDGCDPCLTGANTDEDGDGFLDGCDVCPGVPDDQTDTDGDGVGDVCDTDPTVMNHRVFFDGFSPARPGWNTGFQPWQSTNGDFGPTPPVQPAAILGVWNPASAVTNHGWHVELSAVMPTTTVNNDLVGFDIDAANTGADLAYCRIIYMANTGQWRSFDNSLAITPGARVHFMFHDNPVDPDTCSINGVATSSVYNVTPPGSFVPALVTTNAVEFEWIDVVE